MDKALLAKLGIEVCGLLLKGGLSLARILGVSNEELEATYEKAVQEFLAQDPDNIEFK